MLLSFRIQKQIMDNWCWAAVTSSVALYYNGNSKWFQSTLAARLIDSICSGIDSTNAQSAPPVCNTILDLARSLNLVGNLAGELIRPLSFSEIVQQINSGFPICCQIVFPGFNTSHFVTIYGYQSANVIIGDPQAGIFTVNYNQFLSNYRGGAWRRTLVTKRNISNV